MGSWSRQISHFPIGYFVHQSVKHWLCTTDDLNAMYKAHNPLKGKMQLWCEGRKPMEELETPKPKRRKLCQREEKESLVEEISHELKEKNEENYGSVPFMGTYDSYWCSFK